MIKVIKKDGTKEEFNVQKVVVAVNKSAYRALVTFTEEELDFICNFVTEKVEQMRKKEVTISDMHNVVEGALEQTNPLVAKSYRDYRNYKQDFVHCTNGIIHNMYATLKSVEPYLDKRFLRCHKSFVVNMDYVQKLDSDFTMFSGDKVLIRKNGYADIKNQYWEYINK